MKAAETHRLNLLEYLGNPSNDWPDRKDYALLAMGLAGDKAIYKYFTLAELDAIEREALEIRRTKYASCLGKIDQALRNAAKKGDISAIKLAYQRFEAWSEKSNIEHTGKDGGPIEHLHDYSEQARRGIEELRQMRDTKQIEQQAGEAD